MIKHKLVAAVAAVALSTTLFAGAALAAGTPASEWEAPLKAKMETITQLRTQTQALEAQLKQQTEESKTLREQLKNALTGTLGQQLKDLQAKWKAAVEASVLPLKEQVKALEEQAKAAKAAKDAAQAMVVRAHMAELKLKAAAAAAALKPLRDQAAPLKEQVKAKKEAAQAVEAQMKPLLDQEKALYAKNKELGAQAKKAMEGAQQAMKAGNWNSMLSGLDTVISLRQQAIANLQQIAGLKTKVAAALQAAIGAQKH